MKGLTLMMTFTTLSKDQSLPSKTVSLRIDLTRTIRQDVPALRER